MPVKRKYDSTRRRRQAEQTRQQILQAAHDLFLSDGYAGTTIKRVAAGAGVSVETVYAAFGTKGNLLKQVWNFTLGGDDQDILFRDRPEVLEIRAQGNPARQLEMYASLVALQVAPRIGPFVTAMRGAAAVEPAARRLLEEMDRQRHEAMGFVARQLAATNGLKVSEAEAQDVLWATNPGNLWDLLVQERGWEPDRFATWLGALWKRMLLERRNR